MRAGDGPTLRRRWRGVGARTARRRLPLLDIVGPTRRSLRGSRPRDGDVDLRRTLEDPVEAGHHTLRVVAAVVALLAVILVGRVLLRLPPFAWTSFDVSPALVARDSSSFPSSFLSPLRTSASPRTHASCRDRHHPPLPEASRIERQSIPTWAKISLKKDQRKSRIKAISGRMTYQVNRPLVRPHREAVDMLRLKVACEGRPDSSHNLVVRRSLVGHPTRLEILGRNAGTHLLHPQWPRHQRENPSMMDS